MCSGRVGKCCLVYIDLKTLFCSFTAIVFLSIYIHSSFIFNLHITPERTPWFRIRIQLLRCATTIHNGHLLDLRGEKYRTRSLDGPFTWIILRKNAIYYMYSSYRYTSWLGVIVDNPLKGKLFLPCPIYIIVFMQQSKYPPMAIVSDIIKIFYKC